ncbi:MAG: hypothetical protein GY707_05275 [Desulfobacteraceae bacterium]|nr:hypothetical protein [Desulfobacteraceae bacterium]
MKLLFTCDWHIKLGQKNVPREWQKDRFHEMVDRIEELDYDIMVIGGDIFDKLPSLEEIALYFELIKKFTRPTYIFDGNHEAGKRGYTWLEKLVEATKAINDQVKIVSGAYNLEGLDIIPYTGLKTFNSKDYSNRLLLTHVRGSIPPFVKPEIDLSKFSKWDLVLAGDLHDHSATFEEENAKYNIVYPGSPLSCSFHRNKVTNGVIICDTDTLKWEFVAIKTPQLIRKTISNSDDAISTEYDHTIYEIEGNLEDLSNVSTNDLIDRKVVHSDKESKLNLEGLSITEEIDLYLKEVIMIEDTSDIIGIFNDYAT